MGSLKDWVPDPDGEFNVFFRNYCRIAARNTSGANPVWTHIPAARVAALNDSYAAWDAAWSKLQLPHTAGDVREKTERRAEGEAALRSFNREYILYAEAVSDAQRRDIGCHVRDRHPTPAPRPQAVPEADVVYPGRHLLELAGIRPIAAGGALTAEEERALYGVRIFWGFMGEPTDRDRFRLAEPPVTGKDLPHSVFTRRRKHRFDFDGDSGRTVWFCLRYENKKGGEDGEGPFGPLFSAVVP
jgi:hypothetical protein